MREFINGPEDRDSAATSPARTVVDRAGVEAALQQMVATVSETALPVQRFSALLDATIEVLAAKKLVDPDEPDPRLVLDGADLLERISANLSSNAASNALATFMEEFALAPAVSEDG